MEGGQIMNKYNSGFSNYKGPGAKLRHRNPKQMYFVSNSNISLDRLKHSNLGEYTESNRPKSGGHGQDSIDYMDKNNIPYEITKEYNNGVRVGNLPTSTNKLFRSGSNHTWFPKEWTSKDIENAANYILSTYKGVRTPRTSHSSVYKNVRVTITFGEGGLISTTFPSKKQGGKRK